MENEMVSEPQNEVHLQDVAQIAFTVRNLAEAKSFYRDLLELKFLFEAGTMAFFQCGGISFVQQPHLVARMKSHDLWMAFLKDPAGNTLGLMSEVARTWEKENAFVTAS
jgi:methylmalonyl-CoA/ethylmalonyl-CoA epimerase